MPMIAERLTLTFIAIFLLSFRQLTGFFHAANRSSGRHWHLRVLHTI